MRGDDVPEEHVLLQAELGEHAMDDGRARLGRARAGELTLRRERDPGDARTAVPGRLSDQHEARAGTSFEVRDEPPAQQRGARSLGVLVERLSDPSGRELLGECGRRYDARSVSGSSGKPG